MGQVIIQEETTKNPISLIGKEAGICYGSNTVDPMKNYKRGLGCVSSGHGRAMEYPQIYMVIDGYSAKVMREFYTHIAGGPTRLQASTRYIDYEHGFDVIVPPSVKKTPEAEELYMKAVYAVQDALRKMDELGVPREDSSMILPLGMATKVVVRTNLRNLVDMSGQRMCTRAYWEYRNVMNDMIKALADYSEEWNVVVNELKLFQPKCEVLGFCPEEKGCGRKAPKA